MKKLALALAAFGALTVAAPAVFACDGHGGDKSKTTDTKTAEKTEKEKDKAPAKKAPAKKKDETKKDGDKVSMK